MDFLDQEDYEQLTSNTFNKLEFAFKELQALDN